MLTLYWISSRGAAECYQSGIVWAPIRYGLSTLEIVTAQRRSVTENRAATNRFCVWTKAIYGMIFVAAQKLSGVTVISHPPNPNPNRQGNMRRGCPYHWGFGNGTPKTRGCPYDCNSRNNVVKWKHSVSCVISQVKSSSGLRTDCPVIYTVCRALHVCLLTCLSFFFYLPLALGLNGNYSRRTGLYDWMHWKSWNHG